jgi:hypothetical protein
MSWPRAACSARLPGSPAVRTTNKGYRFPKNKSGKKELDACRNARSERAKAKHGAQFATPSARDDSSCPDWQGSTTAILMYRTASDDEICFSEPRGL